MKSTHPAFTLIEMVVVMAIAAFMAATFIPRMLQRTPKAEWSTILADLNDLMFFARQEAISNQSLRRLAFKQNTQQPDTVVVQEEIDNPEKPGKKMWQQVFSDIATPKYVFHESIKIKGFYHNGKRQNELEDQKGEGYCYITSDGLVEDIRVQLAHKEANSQTEYVENFISSPFFGTFARQEGGGR